MKSVFQKLINSPEEGFVFKSLRGNGCDCPWHFHHEHELILVLAGIGYRIIGDNISPLVPGDVVLIGANLPHVYKYDDYPSKPKSPPRCLLVQFEASLWSGLLELPALAPTRRMLQRAALGLSLGGATRDAVETAMRKMAKTPGVKRIGLFLELLDTIAQANDCPQISSSAFSHAPDTFNEERVNRVCRYINENLHQPITVVQAARLANLSEGAFSRFFHAHLGKTFPAMVNELRIGRACRLLTETDMPVTQVAMSCGYNNLSNFNRQFLRLKGISPRHFRRQIPAAS